MQVVTSRSSTSARAGVPSLSSTAQLAFRKTLPEARFVAKKLYTGEFTEQAHEHLCQTSVHIAFVALGGNPDNEQDFDWSRSRELLARTIDEIRNELKGKGSDFADLAGRCRRRYEGFCNEAVKWSAWHNAGATTETSNVPRRLDANDEPLDEPKPHVDLQLLLDNLTAAVGSADAQLMVDFYMNERTAIEMARAALISETGREPSARELNVRRNHIAQRIVRAKKRAAKALSKHWKQIAVETVS